VRLDVGAGHLALVLELGAAIHHSERSGKGSKNVRTLLDQCEDFAFASAARPVPGGGRAIRASGARAITLAVRFTPARLSASADVAKKPRRAACQYEAKSRYWREAADGVAKR
jgi:hypothetical protein